MPKVQPDFFLKHYLVYRLKNGDVFAEIAETAPPISVGKTQIGGQVVTGAEILLASSFSTALEKSIIKGCPGRLGVVLYCEISGSELFEGFPAETDWSDFRGLVAANPKKTIALGKSPRVISVEAVG